MSLEIEALWREFAAETEEHLDALERLLSDQTGAPRTQDEIGALFRYFHSLKGTFLAMGFTNAEAVAHRCEDILSMARDGSKSLDETLAAELLRAVDRLKGMREEVLATQQDAAPATALLDELDRHRAPKARAKKSKAAAAAPAPVEIPLSEDAELLAIYAEMLDQRLPAAALVLSAKTQDREEAAEVAEELAYGAEMMGFLALADTLRGLAGKAALPPSAAERTAAINDLGELLEQAKVIEDVTSNASGSATLAAALATVLKPDFAERHQALMPALTEFSKRGASASEPLTDALRALRALAAPLGFVQIPHLLLVIEEQLRDPRLPNLAESSRHDLAQRTIAALKIDADGAADLDTEGAAALANQWSGIFDRSESPAVSREITWLRPEVLMALSAGQRSRVEEAVANGSRAYAILLDLEADTTVSAEIIAWLSSAVDTITSRTVYRDGASCFEFFVLSSQATGWIKAQLAALDPENACLRGMDDIGHSPNASHLAEAMPQTGTATIRASQIRVQTETIDDLMAEIGDMRTALAKLADVIQNGQIAKTCREAKNRDTPLDQADPALRGQLQAMESDHRDLKALEQSLESAHRKIWSAGLRLRVIPVDGLFGRLARTARDLAQKLGKDIDVVIEGREVRIDKSIVDVLIDPLMHMVRNAVDHGIELPEQRHVSGKAARARLAISASEGSNSVSVVIADDGKGLDRARILAKALSLGIVEPHQAEQMPDAEIHALIFRPGFSTADQVTEISGRGVGLDVVAVTLQRLGGSISIETSPGAGSKFILKLPLSAALLRVLLVEEGDQILALPERQVVSVTEIETSQIETVDGRPYVMQSGIAIPVQRLGSVLGFGENSESDARMQIAIVSSGNGMIGLHVDKILRFQSVFLKGLHPMLAAMPMIAGASVLGNGRPLLILDAQGMSQETKASSAAGARPASPP